MGILADIIKIKESSNDAGDNTNNNKPNISKEDIIKYLDKLDKQEDE